jgi:hypothetical protein
LRGGATQSLNDAHASVSKKDYATVDEFLAAVAEKVAKRVEQIRSGEVPGTRAPASPDKKLLSAAIAKLRETHPDFDPAKVDVEKLVGYLARQAASGRAA